MAEPPNNGLQKMNESGWGIFVINAIVLGIAVSLFLTIKFADKLTKATLYSYFAFTFLFAILSIATVLLKYLNKMDISLGYVFGFCLNAMLGMMVMFSFNKKVFYALLSTFIAGILGLLYILTNASKSSVPISTTEKDVFNLFDFFVIRGLDDFKSKSQNIFDAIFPGKWEECYGLWAVLYIVLAIVKLFLLFLPSLVGWILVAIMNGMSALFGKVSASDATTATTTEKTWVQQNIPVYLQKAMTYILVLVLFFIVVIVMFSSQKAMRAQPLNVLLVAFVFAFAYLGYIRFYKYEYFTKNFLLTIVALFLVGIYLYNPYNLMDKMTGFNFSAIFFIFIYLVGMILIYYWFKDETVGLSGGLKSTMMADMFDSYFGKFVAILFALTTSIALISYLVSAIGSSTPGMYILNILIVIGMLTIVFNALDSSKLMRDSPYFKLFVSMFLYIPCLLSDLADLLMSEYYKMKYFTFIIVVLEIIFIIMYWVIYPDAVSKLYSGGGKVLVNDPISLSSKRTIGYYRSLSGPTLLDYKTNQVKETDVSGNNLYGAFDPSGNINAVSGKPMLDPSGNPIKDIGGNYFFPTRVNTYRYCMSFWLYINPMPSYGNRFLSLVNYGNNPNVMYNPSTNDFSIFMKSPSTTLEKTCDEDGEIIPIYTNMDMPMQKWFNMVLNYDSGRLDVFMNAELVKSSFDVISCIKYDALTVGQDAVGNELGPNAKLCNFTYFNAPIDLMTIHRMYNITKIEDVPNVPKKDLFSI